MTNDTHQPYAAVIVRSGEPGRREPYAKIVEGPHATDSFPMPMGHNFGQPIPVGTRGVARYITGRHGGLWQFTPCIWHSAQDATAIGCALSDSTPCGTCVACAAAKRYCHCGPLTRYADCTVGGATADAHDPVDVDHPFTPHP